VPTTIQTDVSLLSSISLRRESDSNLSAVYVVGAVILHEGKILCAQRGQNSSLPLKWEFPGGKIESGETPQQALQREIM